jgi:hypothetical protein
MNTGFTRFEGKEIKGEKNGNLNGTQMKALGVKKLCRCN